MEQDLKQHEQLSALVDGQLQGDDFAQALAYAGSEEGVASWQVYQLIGDVLRSPDLARPVDDRLLSRLRSQLAADALPAPIHGVASPVAAVPQALRQPAANASVFRWRLAAGFASMAAVVAIAWNVFGGAPGVGAAPQLAAAPLPQGLVTVSNGGPDAQVMIRDPRLDELLAAHKQFGATSALQMPAGFLRNATFETPTR